MSDWTTISHIRKRLSREWERGLLLATRINKEPLIPRRISLKKPSGKEWVENYDAAKKWAGELVAAEKKNLFTIEFRETVHRQLGRNSFPQAVIFNSEESLFRFIGKSQNVQQFDELCKVLLSDFPELGPWLQKRPLVALANVDNWSRLLAVLSFLKNNPRPGIYVRQLEIPGVDTKFIEKHKKLLSELLDLVLLEDAVDLSATGVKNFEQRYGFTSQPIQIRFRILDEDHYLLGLSDLQIPVEDFRKLNLNIDTVFITENKVNGLAFPEVEGAIVIFGLGFGLELLADIAWLQKKRIYYWGDIDTHGFVMLDQLRSYFPSVCSCLMDKETLTGHRSQWGTESSPTKRELKRLSPDENEVYNLLIGDLLAVNLRLEQEKISFDVVKKILVELLS